MKRFFKASVYIITAVMIVILSAGVKLTANAASLSDTVSLLNPQTNEGNLKKQGYYWDNINDILTIENLSIKTDDDYGLKIKDGATIVLNGNSTIEAEKAALYLSGSISPRGITFQGKGTLTLISENGIGILDASSNKSATVRITSGTINIRSGKDGINSKYAHIALTGGNISIETNEDAYAINAREITINGGCHLTSNSSLFSTSSISISSAYLDIISKQPAIIAESIDITRVDIRTGNSKDDLQNADVYNEENAITTKTNFFLKTSSIIFGEDHTIAADIILLIVMIAVIAVMIIVPVTIKRKKAKRIIAANEAEEAARLKEAKARKKAAAKRSAKAPQNNSETSQQDSKSN